MTSQARSSSSLRPTATKRDSLMAELERDPTSAKRQQRTQAFSAHLAHSSLQRSLLAAEAAKMEAETKLREREIAVERLERDRRWLAEREKEEREGREREVAEREEERLKTDAELRALRGTLSALRDQHAESDDALSSLQHAHAQLLASHKSTLARLEEHTALASERAAAIQALQAQLDASTAASHDPQPPQSPSHTQSQTQSEDWHTISQELHRQTAHLRTLEAANARLTTELARYKQRHESVQVLREEKRALERKVAVVDTLRGEVARLELELQEAKRGGAARDGESEADAPSANTADSTTPSKPTLSTLSTLSALRLTHARLLDTHGTTTDALRTAQAELAAAQARADDAEARAGVREREAGELRERVRRREGRLALAEKEVGFLGRLVASFTAEDTSSSPNTASSNPTSSNTPTPNAPSPHTDTQARLESTLATLEATLAEYKAANAALERALDDARPPPPPAQVTSLSATISTLRAQVATLESTLAARDASLARLPALSAEIAALQKTLAERDAALEDAAQTLFELRGAIGAGTHVPPGMRVLCLRDNPAQRWAEGRAEVVERLRRENRALLGRLRGMGGGGEGGESGSSAAGGPDVVPRESWEVLDREKKELEELVKQKEKRLLRLQQVFTAKSAEFREAIASILGLKLAFYPNGQVRVTSVYDLSASFVFQPSPSSSSQNTGAGGGTGTGAGTGGGARMQLIAQGEGGPQDLPQLMRYWVDEEQCIPGFLASVTLECFDRAKMEGVGAGT
ncbi:hypothetical protein BV22DRAFT_1096636 [Leucogyrophana mollusca]|uniref:Uncharacterized protein n=1 Tax=Leucogyrophana mollusca TaxID=85980 RepID=A0ACB8B7F1_9AGAM|nr:hypothetical protein BV22DRAFT_1096636 [Leucogyrophana mollusca]